MPELPEAETIARQLDAALRGAVVTGLEVFQAGSLVAASGEAPDNLLAKTVRAVWRRGKLVAADLGGTHLLVLHLKMTGRPTLAPTRSPGRHTRFIIRLRRPDGSEVFLHYDDIRRLGRAYLLPAPGAGSSRPLKDLGPDALAVGPARLARILGATRRAVKPLLLDQTRIAGLGNIYADEILHRAGVHPLSPASSLPPRKIRAVHRALRRVLRRAIELGGSSVRDYRQPGGREGSFQKEHAVYGRAGQPCRRCGRPLRRIVVGGRGTSFCPLCQPLPRRREARGAGPRRG